MNEPESTGDLVARSPSELTKCPRSLAARARRDLTVRRPKGRIVVMEDEDLLRELFLEILALEGHEVHGAGTVKDGLRLARELRPDLVHTDGCLPRHADFINVCRAIRKQPTTAHAGLIVCTGLDGSEHELAASEAGADEFINKNPFSPQRYLACVAAVLRRASTTGKFAVEAGPLRINPARHEVLVDGQTVRLTPTERDILHKLAMHPERALSRRELLDRGWAGDDGAVDRTVDVHILAIRRKLGEYSHLVSTVWGVGYRLGRTPDC